MNLSVKNILRFLFPEVQIIDSIKEDGFIVKKQSNQKMNVVNGLSVGQTKKIMQAQQPARSGGAAMHINNMSNRRVSPVSRDVKKPIDNVGSKFEGLSQELADVWVANQEKIDQLCLAFKRPYIQGNEGTKTKNNILIVGNESFGKKYAIEEIVKLLKRRRVFRYEKISKIDFNNYEADSKNGDAFLNDLYKALNMQTELVLMENIEKASIVALDIVKQLMTTGVYQLPGRYMMQNNVLVEATAMLNTASISEINAAGKFFVFTTCQSAEKIMDHLGNSFVNAINDLIILDKFSEEEITRIADMVVGKLSSKIDQQLHMHIKFEDRALEHVRESFNQNQGVNGLAETMTEDIFKPLVELTLRSNNIANEGILKYNEGYVLVSANGEFRLDAYVKKYNAVAVEKVKEELNSVIGLAKVKEYILNLENNLTVQKMREQKGLKVADLSMHMIFTGNPGTGKTTIARIVAKYLKAVGILSSGQLREVSRNDLVGQYMGHTAKLTSEIIQSAKGGVLFIDEAYSLVRDKNDVFGLEAVDALVKGIEDNRDDLVVILAGYQDEMMEFLKSNPGLKSRFPNIIEFDDYSPNEMYEIAEITAKGKGYKLDENCKDGLLELFERSQIRGRNDGGNGRLVRNIIEAAILKQSQRIVQHPDVEIDVLTTEDLSLQKKEAFDLEQKLSEIIGLNEVKEFVRTQKNVLVANEKRKKVQSKVDTSQSLNMVFTGNPGTGKTTISRIVADLFHSMGILKSGQLIETDKSGLIAEYVGQTAKKTEEVFKSALGGVLFIDEAYAITNDGSSFGQECIDTLVKLIEDYRGEILVILAGYTKEMKDFMKANSGLESRFPLQIEFPDYSAEELYLIGKKMVRGKGFTLTDDSDLIFKKAIFDMKKTANSNSGNGRMVRNFVEEIVRKQSSRIAINDIEADQMNIIIPSDIVSDETKNNQFDLEKELEKVIGLNKVKEYIRSLNARLRVQEARKLQGLKIDTTQTLHMIFKGNPGTGKTMMARTVANVLYNMGVISTNKLIETDRSGLVAGYVGQTALKTREVIESALDGVLFIDEAYSLAQGGDNDFGREAIDTLVKMMDDNRDRLVVILAGYSNDMDNFLTKNAGLKSRFPNIIEFPDYSTAELLEIAKNIYSNQGYELDISAINKLENIFEKAKENSQFGNGRYVRNIYEKSLNRQALRLSQSNNLAASELVRIIDRDIEEV